jgi:anti-anti-sigma factor
MEITTSHIQGPPAITVLHLHGKLDGNNYEALIDAAQQEYDNGARSLLLDFSNVTYISSAGLSALHTVALLFKGQSADQRPDGWASFHAMEIDRAKGPQAAVKLLRTSNDVKKVLDLVGFNTIFDTYSEFQDAVDSFNDKSSAGIPLR